jgi:hypothetical protein
MASKLLARLDAAIGRTRDPVQLACLRAERAGFLGRHGQVSLARTQLQDIQRQFARHPHVAVSGWLAVAEGQIDIYNRLGSGAHDRFNRAYALSRAAGLTALQALSAAWLAHSEDVRGQREHMAALCAEALQLAAPDHHAARWRAALTLAGSYHLAGRMERAAGWYTAARTHAMADGDEVAVSALMYTQAALRVVEARFGEAFQGSQASLPAALGTEAVDRFDAVIGVQSMTWMVPMLRAQLLVLQGEWAQALALMDEHLPRSEAGWQARMQAPVRADRAWCLWHLGRRDEALQDIAHARHALSHQPCDLDDRALAQARMAQVLQADGQREGAQRLRAAAEADLQAHRADQQALAALLDRALDAESE